MQNWVGQMELNVTERQVFKECGMIVNFRAIGGD